MQPELDLPIFTTIQPKVLYFGTPVALITTIDQAAKPNLAPVSSVWALGYNLMLGLGCDSKTYQNLLVSQNCVVNLPSAELYGSVEKIAKLTGLDPVPAHKSDKYSFHHNKFLVGNFNLMAAEQVASPAVANCPIQLECVYQGHTILESSTDGSPLLASFHLKVVNVRVHNDLVINISHINPAAWSPLIYNFRHYYKLGQQLGKNFRAETG